KRKSLQRKFGQSRFLIGLKIASYLLTRGAMNPCVGNGSFPVSEMFVLCGEGFKFVSAKRILLDVIDTTFHLPLVSRSSHPCRYECTAIVFAEIDQFRIEFRVVPVRRLDGALGIVKNDSLWHTAERPKRILKSADKAFGILLENGLGITFS